jgi:hypothetical protein
VCPAFSPKRRLDRLHGLLNLVEEVQEMLRDFFLFKIRHQRSERRREDEAVFSSKKYGPIAKHEFKGLLKRARRGGREGVKGWVSERVSE